MHLFYELLLKPIYKYIFEKKKKKKKKKIILRKRERERESYVRLETLLS